MLLKNKVAIITGATRGIGKAIFYRLAQEGAHAIGVYSSSDHLAEAIKEELKGVPGDICMYKGSVTDRSFVSNMMKDVCDQFGRIDVLINNAGIVRDQFLYQMPEQDWLHVFETNFLGTYICCTEALPYMEKQAAGRIVNVVSVTGVVGREAQTNYGASKGSIIGLTRLLARRYAKKGVYVNAVAPGMIRTEMIEHVPAEKLENFLRYTNMGRLGEVDEIARTVLFLSSSLSDYISDTVIQIDGGFIR
jgi:3-oxoacyl-[acyl-carrier protein] reductase